MQFKSFVLPFNIGLYFIILYVVARCIIWLRDLPKTDKLRIQRGFFGRPFVASLKEIFMESLIHRKIYKTNPILGYMHMSFAFGWFMLILLGTIEADFFGEKHLNPPYKAIFFRYFNPEHGDAGFARSFGFVMDLLLAYILSGLLIAIIKRVWSRIVGMRRTTRLKFLDKTALTALWLIFPSRLLAESFTCGAYGSGSFLTGSLGNFFAGFLPVESLAMPFWWLYSLSLGMFFILLPRTRYMHIPTELFLIFMRNSGVRIGDQHGACAETQIHACSSCGICLDVCQLSSSVNITDVQAAYLVKGLKRDDDIFDLSLNCLMCGRCEQACPVGIELGPLRMIQRRVGDAPKDMRSIWSGYMRTHKPNGEQQELKTKQSFSYLPKQELNSKPEVLYFAGCMTHLTPGISRSMELIFRSAEINYEFMDKDGSVCCGRPLTLAGKDREARELIRNNTELIWRSEAKILVTSCPICYKIFKESYHVDVEILHHSEYLNRLIQEKRIRLNFLNKSVVYHDPCELGRNSGIYSAPREVLVHVTRLLKSKNEKENALCCGGSLANLKIDRRDVSTIAEDVFNELTGQKPDYLATACPLCKKTFGKISNGTFSEVKDIAEIVGEAILPEQKKESSSFARLMKVPASI